VAKKIYLISKKIVSILTIVDPKDRFVTRENLTFGLVPIPSRRARMTECRPLFIQRLPENITLLSVLTAHGLDLASFNGKLYLCPFHVDKRPSLQLNKPEARDGWFYCHSCKEAGNMIHWLSKKYGIKPVAAYRQLRAERGLAPDQYVGSCHRLGPVYIGGLRDFSDLELEQLCASRTFSFAALKKQLCPQILKYVPHYCRHSAYALCDPLHRTAVLRRMDGKPWSDHDDSQKARMAKNSNSAIPIGVHAIGNFTNVMLCEGGPDYLRLVSLIHECDSSAEILPLMISSTTARKIDPRLIDCFKDKRVRICAHNDEPGIAAACSWQDQLETVGAVVDIWVPPKIQLPDGGFTKDLDDLFWKLNPDIRGKLREVHELINLDIRLFPAYELLKQG
jgi:CHC2 zinc finger